MARPIDPTAEYRIRPHVTKGYTYASTQPAYVEPLTGKRKYRYIHWGTVDKDLKFTPGSKFYLASPEERGRLIFPEGWDISEATKFSGRRMPGRPAYDEECQNRMYGDIWILEQVAIKTGIRQDLKKVFDGNQEIVDDILTLAMFPYVTQHTYNRVGRWQRNAKTPSSRALTPTAITRLTQSIAERHRMDLLKLRAARLGKNELCAVDSTSRSAYGDRLADIRWGKNKENPGLEQTTEVVVYTLSGHMPVYYRTFPGNMPDSRSLDVIITDLAHADFKNLVLITDRGYESMHNLDRLILRGQSIIMCAKTSQREVARAIGGLGEFGSRPKEMMIDPDADHYFIQYDINYSVENSKKIPKVAKKLKLNLYFDPVRKGNEIKKLDIAISSQKAELDELLKNESIVNDVIKKNNYGYYTIVRDPKSMAIQSYKLNEKKVEKALKFSGFFSILTYRLDFDAKKVFDSYRLRDEQEKYFQQMKDQMVSDRQRNWSEEGKTGRLLILFVSLILGSYVRHVWKSTELYKEFSSSLEVLDEMRSIRCIEHTNRAKVITPFIGAQVDICKAFGFDIPDGCAPTYTLRQKQRRKRGRPPKKMGKRD